MAAEYSKYNEVWILYLLQNFSSIVGILWLQNPFLVLFHSQICINQQNPRWQPTAKPKINYAPISYKVV